ncbi:MAG TPA: Uma2 family endonuclease [Saprospiraceae bacterium]|nr:Uma2 family endonuclease [Saprospiraceae bacterium]
MQEKDISHVQDPAEDFGIEYTYADYLKFEFEEMVELIRGKIFRMSPAPKTAHQKVSGNLLGIFWQYLKQRECQVFHAPFDVILPVANRKREKATTVVQPDIVVICRPEIIEEAGCFGVPDLIIEILSPHTSKKDLQLKYDVYEEAGVPEYWIVMAELQLIEVFVLEHGKYQRITTYVKEDQIIPRSLPGLTIHLEEVFS